MLENQGKGSTVCNLERSTLSTRGHARSPARRGDLPVDRGFLLLLGRGFMAWAESSFYSQLQ